MLRTRFPTGTMPGVSRREEPMSEGKRPGGLTAMAVINFVVGAFNLLLIFLLILALNAPDIMAAQRDRLVKDGASEERLADMDEQIAKVESDLEKAGGTTGIYVQMVAAVLFGVLLIAGGIGYLKQRRVLGRTVGNIYGVLGIVLNVGVAVAIMFSFGLLVSLLYPVLTLVLVNTTFKDDLVN